MFFPPRGARGARGAVLTPAEPRPSLAVRVASWAMRLEPQGFSGADPRLAEAALSAG